jgi:hypothetical protein
VFELPAPVVAPQINVTTQVRGSTLFIMASIPVEKPDAIIVAHPRSGAHSLESSLGSHPKIHSRGEFILRYKRLASGNAPLSDLSQPSERSRLENRPGFLNIAIVAYPQIPLFREICGALVDFRLIHLLRDPEVVARSITQLEQKKLARKRKLRSDFESGEAASKLTPASAGAIKSRTSKIIERQQKFTEKFRRHPRHITLSYEELFDHGARDILPESAGRRLLAFLSLEFSPLTNGSKRSRSAEEDV